MPLRSAWREKPSPKRLDGRKTRLESGRRKIGKNARGAQGAFPRRAAASLANVAFLQTPGRPQMQIGLIARRVRATRCFFGVLLLCAALLPAAARSADAPSPVKLAIFDFELEDLSAGPGESPADTLLLKQ